MKTKSHKGDELYDLEVLRQTQSPVLWCVVWALPVSRRLMRAWVFPWQQHGSVYRKTGASQVLTSLSPDLPLREQLQVSVAGLWEAEKLLREVVGKKGSEPCRS